MEHIPPGTTAEQLKGFFDPEDRPRIEVRSIMLAVYINDPDGSRIAIITFHGSVNLVECPRLLDNDLSVDSDFYRFTPLNHPEGSIVAECVCTRYKYRNRYPVKSSIIAVTGLAAHAYGSWAHYDQRRGSVIIS